MDDDSLTGGVPGRRIGAFAIDLAVILILTLCFSIAFAILHVMSLGLLHGPAHLVLIIGLCYLAGFIAGPGAATPGQRAMGLSVRRQEDLGRPSLVQAIAFVGLLYLTLLAGVIWLGVVFFTVRRRALHDMLAGLVVVRADAADWRPW